MASEMHVALVDEATGESFVDQTMIVESWQVHEVRVGAGESVVRPLHPDPPAATTGYCLIAVHSTVSGVKLKVGDSVDDDVYFKEHELKRLFACVTWTSTGNAIQVTLTNDEADDAVVSVGIGIETF